MHHEGSQFPDQGSNPCCLQWKHRVLPGSFSFFFSMILLDWSCICVCVVEGGLWACVAQFSSYLTLVWFCYLIEIIYMWFGIGFTCHPGNAQVYRKSFSSFSVPQGSNQPSCFWETPGLAEALFTLAVTQNYYWPQGDIDCILGDFFGFVFPTSYARQIQIAEGDVLKMQGTGKVCSVVFVWEDMQALESSDPASNLVFGIF